MTQLPFLPEPIFSIGRNKISEILVYGQTFILQDKNLIFGPKDTLDQKFMCRSLLKPWQFEAMNIGDQHNYWSLCFASHSYQSIHKKALEDLKTKTSIEERDLQCPHDFPLDPKVKYELISDNTNPKKIFHQCSGKHIGFIHSSRIQNFDTKDYLSSTHPINQRFLANLKKHSLETPIVGIDGCLNAAAGMSYQAFLHLCQATMDEPSEKMRLCFELWKDNPRLVGGINRLDSDISEDLGGEFLAKEGADGLIMVLHPETKTTILTKIYHGVKKEWLVLALWSALKTLNSKEPHLHRLKDYLTLKIRNSIGDHQEINLIQSKK